MTDANKELVKKAIADNAKELSIVECGVKVAVIFNGKIKLPAPNEDVRRACKPLYMAACNIRDGKTRKWEGVEIPSSYWPEKGQSHSGSTEKPLVKISVGSAMAEIDLSDPLAKENAMRIFESMFDRRLEAYQTSIEAKTTMAKFDAIVDTALALLKKGKTKEKAIKMIISDIEDDYPVEFVEELATKAVNCAINSELHKQEGFMARVMELVKA